MLYLFYIEKAATGSTNIASGRTDSKDTYHLFETHTESIIKVKERFIISLIEKHKMEGKNIYIDNGKVQIKEWPHSMTPNVNHKLGRSPYYILLGRIAEHRFKLISNLGSTVNMSEKSLKILIASGKVANCDYRGIEEKTYKSMDTYEIKINSKFASHTAQKYEEFKAKAAMLGMDISFNYLVENEDIKIMRYTGTSTKLILPNFITTICDGAFRFSRLKEINLNNGLKHIGNNAFMGNDTTFIKLPETMEFAIQDSIHLNLGGATSKNVYKRLNPNTLIINNKDE